MVTDERSLKPCVFCGGPVRITQDRDDLTFYTCEHCAATGVHSDSPEQRVLDRREKQATRERQRY